MVTVIIPSRNEVFLDRTVKDVLVKARGPVEVIVVLDGYDTERIPGVIYIHHPEPVGMRAGIAGAVAIATGKYIMKLDAHCIVDEGFDVKLAADCEENWVVVPRRYKLDDEKWEPKAEYVDYEHFIYPKKYNPVSLHGFRSKGRSIANQHLLIDDRLTFQGSCWFMHKTWFDKHKFLQDPGYMGVPHQEAEEIGLTTWLSGGRVVTNKKTWYAHLFKGAKHGRGYRIENYDARQCYAYSYNKWVIEHKDGFIKLIEKFWPLPEWPDNWQQRLWM